MSLGDAHHPGLTGPLRTTEQVISITSTSSHPPFPSTRPISNEYGFMEPGGRTSASSRRQASESSSLAYSELQLAPATRTSTVTTTTTTTVHFAPILIPRSAATRPSSSQDARASFAQLVEQEERNARDPSKVLALDPKLYPLSQSPWPGGMKQFRLGLGGEQATFYEGGREAVEHEHDMLVAGQGRDKGKGRAEDELTDELPSHLSHAPGGSDSSNYGRDRGSAAQRRRPRRTRPTIVTGSTLPGAIDEDDASMSHEMDSGVDMGGGAAGARLPSPGPPRKRPRATSSHGRSQNERTPSEETDGIPPTSAAAMFSHQVSLGASAGLPSPNLSPPSPVPTFVEDDSQEFGDKGDDHGGDVRDQFDLGSGRPISALLALPDFVNMFDELSPALQSYFIYTFLKRSSIPVLQTINNIIAPSLRRDFLTDLPPELGLQVLGYLDTKTLCRASVVCKGWRRLVDGEWRVWKQRLLADELWTGDGSEEKEAKEIAGGSKQNLFLKRWKSGVWDENPRSNWESQQEDSMHIDGIDAPSPRRFSYSHTSVKLASPSSSREASPFPHAHFVHPFKTLYRRRFVTRRNWQQNEPKRVTFACHANNVVTCLQFDKDKIVSASDDHSINVFDTRTGATKARLNGHEGGVWALQYIGNILVSGSTDRTVRVWNLDSGKCTHVFVGHTSTVRCLQIVEPENINPDPNGEPIWEPPYPLIVTGSRDWSLRVWKLPSPGKDAEYHPAVPMSPTEENTNPLGNPYHLKHLSGHRHAVRALAAHGRTLVSGSYDCVVRVWDILSGECRHRLTGHTQKVYSVVFDHLRKQCASGSMDGTVKLWSTETGECRATLEGHSSLVGLLGLSYRHLVSAAADSTLRIWNPATGECRQTLAAHSGAITCFQHDEYKVISGSDGTLKMWNVADGTFTRDLLTGLTGVWQVSFDQRFCVAAVQRNGHSEFEILDFGAIDGEQDEFETGRIKEEVEEEEVDEVEVERTEVEQIAPSQDDSDDDLSIASPSAIAPRPVALRTIVASGSGTVRPAAIRTTAFTRGLASGEGTPTSNHPGDDDEEDETDPVEGQNAMDVEQQEEEEEEDLNSIEL